MPPTELKGPAYFVQSYRESPIENLILLKGLWNMQKGSIRTTDDILCSMLCALSLGFRDLSGCTIDEGGESPPGATVEGALWEAFLVAEFPLVLLEMIKNETFAKQPYDWMLAVLVLNAGAAKIWESRAHSRASGTQAQKSRWKAVPDSLAERYFQSLRGVWDGLWQKRGALLSDENTAKPGIAAALIVFAHSVTLLHVNVYPTRQNDLTKIPLIVGMSLASWTAVAASTNPEAQLHPDQHYLPFKVLKHWNDCAVMLQASLVDPKQVATLWRFTVDTALKGIGRSKLMQACYTALSAWPLMTGLNLQMCLQGLKLAVSFDPVGEGKPLSEEALAAPFCRAYWEAPILDSMAVALLRESQRVGYVSSALAFNTEVHAGMVIACSELIHFTLDGLEHCVDFPPVTDGGSMYKILSLCLHILSNVVKDSADKSKSIIMFAKIRFTSVFERLTELCNGRQLSKTSVQTSAWHRIVMDMGAVAQDAWKADTDSLVQSAPNWKPSMSVDRSYDILVERRAAFGKALSAAASKLSADRSNDSDAAEKGKRLCSCVGCPFHAQPCPTKLSVCAGCGKQQYCSRDCQKKDWKLGGHRIKCRRLKA